MSGPLLEVVNLERHFEGLKAVDGISFTVAPSEVVSIIGPNGSGKTTTLNLVTGTIPSHGGTISLEGLRIDHGDTARIAEHGVARTFQNGRVFATLSVADNIEVGIHSTLHASRPFRRLSHLFVLRWISLLGELFVAIVGTPGSRRERQQIDATVKAEIHRFEARLGPRRDDPAYSLAPRARAGSASRSTPESRPRFIGSKPVWDLAATTPHTRSAMRTGGAPRSPGPWRCSPGCSSSMSPRPG